MAKTLACYTQNAASVAKIDHNKGFQEKRQFKPKMVKNRKTFVIVHNIHP
jgi:hypothetical protein